MEFGIVVIFFNSNYPEINVDEELLDIMHKEDVLWFGNSNMKTIDDVISYLVWAKQDSRDRYISLSNAIVPGQKVSPAYAALVKNPSNMHKYESFKRILERKM